MGSSVPTPEEPARVFGDWLRTGYCCRCGSCCVDEESPTHYCSLFALRWDAGREGYVGHCGDRTSASSYVLGCNVWPSKPEHVAAHPQCTYRFERVDADK